MKNADCYKLCNHFCLTVFISLNVYVLTHFYVTHKVGYHSVFSSSVPVQGKQIPLAFLYTVGKESHFHLLRFIIWICFPIQQRTPTKFNVKFWGKCRELNRCIYSPIPLSTFSPLVISDIGKGSIFSTKPLKHPFITSWAGDCSGVVSS